MQLLPISNQVKGKERKKKFQRNAISFTVFMGKAVLMRRAISLDMWAYVRRNVLLIGII